MLEDMVPEVRVTPCKVRKVAAEMSVEDNAILTAALDNVEDWSSNALARALCQRGVIITEKPIRRHRNKECSCS